MNKETPKPELPEKLSIDDYNKYMLKNKNYIQRTYEMIKHLPTAIKQSLLSYDEWVQIHKQK